MSADIQNNKEKYADLVCPLGKYPLVYENDKLVCPNCGAAYLIKDGIADLLIDDAVLPAGIQNINRLKCYKL